jgi:NAD(P)-dependent dehydrogenase (short-subunit alcohol dehydrogenase family)
VQAFIPLLRRGHVKKVVNISTGMAELELTNDHEIAYAGSYSVSKAAANAIVAKYNATYKQEGILFLSISPGYVFTERQGAREFPFLPLPPPLLHSLSYKVYYI